MKTGVRILVVGLLVLVLMIASGPIHATGLMQTDTTQADGSQIETNSAGTVAAIPDAIHHVTGWLYTNSSNVVVFLEKNQNGVWSFMYSRTLNKAGAFGFYDLEYGQYRVRTFRPGVYRYCVPSAFWAGHKSDGSDVRQYVECRS
jgi:hypothetical protein